MGGSLRTEMELEERTTSADKDDFLAENVIVSSGSWIYTRYLSSCDNSDRNMAVFIISEYLY